MAKKKPRGPAKPTATATARPGLYDHESDSDSSVETTAVEKTSAKSSSSAATNDKEADDEDEWILKFSMQKRKKWPPAPKRPKPNMLLVCIKLLVNLKLKQKTCSYSQIITFM